jgi:Flp pilus assembly protein TadD
MEKLSMKQIGVIAMAAMAVAACNPLNKMSKYANDVKYSVNPNPLEMHGDSVAISINGKFPPKFFHKMATVTATPVLKNANGEVVKEFKETKLIGSEVDGDGQKIDYEKGGSFTYSDKIPYDASMANVEIFVKAVAGYKTKTKEFETQMIGSGTKATPLWVQNDAKPVMAKDNFVKVIPRSSSAQINYDLQSSVVKGGELNDADIKEMKTFITDGVSKGFVFKGASIMAYASPDGEMALNENLANDRAKSAGRELSKMLNSAKVQEVKNEGFTQEVGKGEDWDGFKTAMQASSIPDKDLILRVLTMTDDLQKREQEIKNMAATYVEIADKILPGLRRSQITLNAEERARTDEEIKALTNGDASQLSVEELLYAATLSDDLNEKLRIYRLAKQYYSNDWRTSNNVGYILVLQGDIKSAKAEFDAAAKAQETPIVSNNLGVVALFEGKTQEAADYFAKGAGAGNEARYNAGIIDIKRGNYASAVSNMGGENTLNSGLAKLLNGDTDGAQKAIDASSDANSAAGYYLKAVIGARTGNKDMVINNLKSALGKDGSLKTKAANDAEFTAYRMDEGFKALVQ